VKLAGRSGPALAIDAAHLLGPDGPLAQRLPGYELREGQLAMATAVERALADDRVLLCEAGTGTGKTLAYLVPALRSGRRVVVATASKALQEQIAHKDLPLLREHLGLDVDAVLVKGLANYLCLRRYGELRAGFVAGAWDGATRRAVERALPMLESWARSTHNGDRSELSSLPESHPIWPLVTSSSDTRIGPRCEHYDACHVTRVKRAAENAQVLIVNHHLLFADLAIKGEHPGGVLPAYDALIVDEAHRLEDVATSFFGHSVSSQAIARMLQDAERSLVAAMLHDRAEPPSHLAVARARAEELLAAINAVAGGARRGSGNDDGREPLPEIDGHPGLRDRYFALDDALATVAQIVGAHAHIGEALAQVAARVAKLREDLAAILYPARARVAWIDRRDHGIAIAASPVDVGAALRERLFARGMGVVLTSASLTASGSFAFIRARLGLAEQLDAPIDELVVEPALDYATTALLYTPTDLPDVVDSEFAPRAAERIAELVSATPGGAFVLCTSVRSMQRLSTLLATAILERTHLTQGEAPKRTLLDRFRAAGNAVLCATMSFWEGVDVPGSALRLVVIDRLPFDVPSDPLIGARCRAISESGGSPFRDYSVPRAAIMLKQGFGRLLRTRADRGVVAVLDRRIATRGYGAALQESLPPARRTQSLDEVVRFWRPA
jgi:ATP-dependent DNA helicase DinG